MNVIPLVKPFMPPPEVMMPKLQAVLYSGYIAEGAAVKKFEREFSEWMGCDYVLSVNSGTAALHLALILAGVGQGDEVISTALTAEPTNIAIAMAGGKVVWADVHPTNGLISAESINERISARTKAIMVVHYAGMVCDMEQIRRVSTQHGIPVIEDCAHALGARYDGASVGANSDYAVFSFQAIKHITTVDGGMLKVSNEKDYARAKLLRWFGLSKGVERKENRIGEAGFKYHMNDVTATIGSVQMQYVNDIVNRCRTNGRFFDASLAEIPDVELCEYNSKADASYWLYTMLVHKRDLFCERMAQQGIIAAALHLRNDLHPVFDYAKRELPGLDEFVSRYVHIPCGYWVGESERQRIIGAVKEIQL